MKMEDLVGRKFNKLTVIRFSHKKKKIIFWVCVCDCSKEKEIIVAGCHLRDGHTTSCGCNHSISVKKQRKFNDYIFHDDYVSGFTVSGKEFLIDLDDYDKIKNYCWHGTEYMRTGTGGKAIGMHRLIMNADDNMVVDHINHNVSDNRKSNLRVCSRHENSFNCNMKTNNTSGRIGVQKRKWGYVVYIKVNYENIYIGSFKVFEEAVKAREEAEIKYFGEYRYKGKDND